MKNIIISFIVGIIVSLAGVGSWYFIREPLKPRLIYIDKHKSERDSLKQINELRDKQLAQSESVIEKQYYKLNSITSKISMQKERADSAEARYNRQKTIDGCDSTLKAKNAVISTQNDKITEQKVTLNEFSNTVQILKYKDKTNNLVIDSQDITIQEQSKEIEANNCCRNWFINHPFWRWLHNPKCN